MTNERNSNERVDSCDLPILELADSQAVEQVTERAIDALTPAAAVDSNYAVTPPSSDVAFTKAKKEGWKIILPKQNELLIDIDGEDAMHTFFKVLPLIQEYVGVESWNARPSKSGDPNRQHITVILARFVEPAERITLQLMLGSDPRREALSWIELQNGDKFPTLFYEKV